MTNLFTIIDAWVVANNPTRNQIELSDERAKICETCPSKKEIIKGKQWSFICGECGCPIAKKTFTPKDKQCPLGKWEEVESNYFPKKEKTNKSVI